MFSAFLAPIKVAMTGLYFIFTNATIIKNTANKSQLSFYIQYCCPCGIFYDELIADE
jgi:hypothetical protein